MSVSKVQRSKDAAASVIYVVYGTRDAMVNGTVRAAAVSVVGPRGANPMAWAMETRDLIARSVQRGNETINVIQSFSPDELDPHDPMDVEKAHAAGLALAATLAPDCDVVVATHTDKAHVHNHIIIANHDRKTGLAAPKVAGNAWRVRFANDEVMESFGLAVLEQHEVSYSRQERVALAQDRDIDGSSLDLDTLTGDTWREFMRARVEDLIEDQRVVSAIDVDGGDGVESALDVMEAVAWEYHLSFSRRGRGKRKSERSSFALVDDKCKELRVTGHDGHGSTKAVSAGSRLGADYTLNAIRARLHELHAQQLIDGLETEENGIEYTTYEVGPLEGVEQVGLGVEGCETVDRGDKGGADWGAGRPGRAVADLSEATDELERANGFLEAFNRGNGGVREGDGPSHVLDEGDGGDRRGAARGNSAPARGVTEVGGRDSGTADEHGRTTENRARTRRRAVESQRRRNREVERLRREAVASDGPKATGGDYEPGF